MIIFVGNGYVGYFCGMILNIRRMKKISLIGLVVLAIFIAKSAQREEVVSELMMRNVEALAESEKDLRPSKCWGSGKVDCFTGDKVEYRFFLYGLDDELETE